MLVRVHLSYLIISNVIYKAVLCSSVGRVLKRNRLCHRDFEKNLDLCVGIFIKLTHQSIYTTFTIKDTNLIRKTCYRNRITYRGPTNIRKQITVKMFKCPLSRLDFWLHKEDNVQQKITSRDFYISRGTTNKHSVFIFNRTNGSNVVCANIEYDSKAKDFVAQVVSSREISSQSE